MRYKKTLAYSLLGLGLSLNARADVPSVVVDIAPLHSLVHQVMQGVGEPSLIIPAEASPHSYTLRPSQAKAVAEAEIVFWIGQELTPWLEKSIDNLASSARVVSMLSTDGITNYAYRDQAIFEEHDHEDEHHDHHHDAVDPHAWLDPKNAKVWVEVIRSTLTAHDPVNANIYANNAERATASLDQLIDSVARQIEGIGALKFIVFHDAYQYFEKRFGILSQGSISLSDAKDPSPARIEAIQDAVKRLNVTCLFTEPQYNPKLVKAVFADQDVTIGMIDPLGSTLPTGSEHYSLLLEGMVESLVACHHLPARHF